MTDSQAIRKKLLRTRRQLSEHEQLSCALALAGQVIDHPFFLNSRNLAAYLPVNGEMNPFPLILNAWERNKAVYLPVLLPYRHNRLWFAPYRPDTKLIRNRFGIPEPQFRSGELIPPCTLDLVLTPLVAFDEQCNRMGMGGGFYDRTFAFLRHRRHWVRPRLLGLAYELQKTDSLAVAPWDIPLWGVATEDRLYLRNRIAKK